MINNNDIWKAKENLDNIKYTYEKQDNYNLDYKDYSLKNK